MGWEIGYDSSWGRDIGYGVPAECDHPECKERIDRGLAYVCGDGHDEHGCGLFFCDEHLTYRDVGEELVPSCERCEAGGEPFEPKPDVPEWIEHKATDPSWAEWRAKEAAAGHRRRSA